MRSKIAMQAQKAGTGSKWVSVDIAEAPQQVVGELKIHIQNFANTIASFALKTKRNLGQKTPPRLLELGRVLCEGNWYIFVAEMWSNEVPGGNVQAKRLLKAPEDEEDDILEYDEIDKALARFMSG